MKNTVLFLGLFIGGCDFLENDYVEREPEVYYELKHLPKMMSLPKQPLEIKWEQPVPNKFGQSSIVALMRFSPEDYDYIMENSDKFDIMDDNNLPITFFDKWVDKSIADKMTLIKTSDEYITKGYSRFQANLFTRIKGSPYVTGRVHPLASEHILVILTAN